MSLVAGFVLVTGTSHGSVGHGGVGDGKGVGVGAGAGVGVGLATGAGEGVGEAGVDMPHADRRETAPISANERLFIAPHHVDHIGDQENTQA